MHKSYSHGQFIKREKNKIRWCLIRILLSLTHFVQVVHSSLLGYYFYRMQHFT